MKYFKYLSLAVVFLLMPAGLCLNPGSGFFSRNVLSQVTAVTTPRRVFWGAGDTLPPEITYRLLFDEIALLDEEDKRPQKSKTAFKASFYEDRLGLKPSQFAALDAVVSQYLEKRQALDVRAKQIINDYRAQLPNGELAKPKPTPESNKVIINPMRLYQRPFEPLPDPPAELIELQARKNNLALEMKDKIKQALGEAEFSKFEAAIKRNAEGMMVPESSHKPAVLQMVPGS